MDSCFSQGGARRQLEKADSGERLGGILGGSHQNQVRKDKRCYLEGILEKATAAGIEDTVVQRFLDATKDVAMLHEQGVDPWLVNLIQAGHRHVWFVVDNFNDSGTANKVRLSTLGCDAADSRTRSPVLLQHSNMFFDVLTFGGVLRELIGGTGKHIRS